MRSTYVRTYVLSAGEGEHMERDEGEEMDGRGALRAGFCAVGLRARLLGTKALLASESRVAGGAPGTPPLPPGPPQHPQELLATLVAVHGDRSQLVRT